MAKSFLESLGKIEKSTNRIVFENEERKTAILNEPGVSEEIDLVKPKSKAGRKPIRQNVYIKRTIELREDLLNKLEVMVYDKRSSKREEIEKALEAYFK